MSRTCAAAAVAAAVFYIRYCTNARSSSELRVSARVAEASDALVIVGKMPMRGAALNAADTQATRAIISMSGVPVLLILVKDLE